MSTRTTQRQTATNRYCGQLLRQTRHGTCFIIYVMSNYICFLLCIFSSVQFCSPVFNCLWFNRLIFSPVYLILYSHSLDCVNLYFPVGSFHQWSAVFIEFVSLFSVLSTFVYCVFVCVSRVHLYTLLLTCVQGLSLNSINLSLALFCCFPTLLTYIRQSSKR